MMYLHVRWMATELNSKKICCKHFVVQSTAISHPPFYVSLFSKWLLSKKNNQYTFLVVFVLCTKCCQFLWIVNFALYCQLQRLFISNDSNQDIFVESFIFIRPITPSIFFLWSLFCYMVELVLFLNIDKILLSRT